VKFQIKFEENRVGKSAQDIFRRHTEMYILAFRAQDEGKMELPLDMVSFFHLSAFFGLPRLPD
jgi:hypothetical protein